jgi:hypothetical protein
MSTPNRTGKTGISESEQTILNHSFDKDFATSVNQPLGFDGVNLQRQNADNLATKIEVSGKITYIAMAAPGTTEDTAKWQCKAIDETTGVVITWADGDANFDNLATDISSLDYS